MDLSERVAVITGGTGGIGLGIAQAFNADGIRMIITGRNSERGEKAVAELGGADRAVFVAGDARDRQHIEDAVDTAVERFGRLDVMVNNSGGATSFGLVAEMSDEVWDSALEWNLTSPFWGCRRALKYMIPQQSGRIVNMASVEGKHGKPAMAQYVAAKHGLVGFTKALAQEVGELGITVNAICPGLVLTDLVLKQAEHPAALQNITPEEFLAVYAREAAIKRFNTVDEVAALAAFLASDAARGITGAALNVDGGTAGY